MRSFLGRKKNGLVCWRKQHLTKEDDAITYWLSFLNKSLVYEDEWGLGEILDFTEIFKFPLNFLLRT